MCILILLMYDTQIEEGWKEMLADVDLLLLSIPTQCTKWLTTIVVVVITNGYPPRTYSVQGTMKNTKKSLIWYLLSRHDTHT